MPVALTLVLSVAGFGCRTQQVATLPWQASGFLSGEVLSRTWTNADGRVMQLLGSSTRTSKNLGEFLIVRFGDNDLNEAYCCEFYLVNRVPSKTYTDTSCQDLPVRTMPEYTVNYLLARHCSAGGVIGSIDMKDGYKKVVFSFDERAKHQYLIEFSHDVAGKPRKIGIPWNGGELWQLTLSERYEPHWSSRIYMDTSHKRVNPN